VSTRRPSFLVSDETVGRWTTPFWFRGRRTLYSTSKPEAPVSDLSSRLNSSSSRYSSAISWYSSKLMFAGSVVWLPPPSPTSDLGGAGSALSGCRPLWVRGEMRNCRRDVIGWVSLESCREDGRWRGRMRRMEDGRRSVRAGRESMLEDLGTGRALENSVLGS
jgi:hypothetical protein